VKKHGQNRKLMNTNYLKTSTYLLAKEKGYGKDGNYPLPYQHLIHKWLRDKNVFVEVLTDCTTEPKFCYDIHWLVTNKDNTLEWFHRGSLSDLYYEYEEALEYGMIEGLNLIK
jgi:hypothetical protein